MQMVGLGGGEQNSLDPLAAQQARQKGIATRAEGAQRFAVTREILETLSSNMTQAASKMPEPKAAAKAT